MNDLDAFRRYPLPSAPEGLRERVLARARQSAASAPPLSRTDRIWYSPRWRLAWLGALTAMVALEVQVARTPRAEVPVAKSEAAATAAALGLPSGRYVGNRVVSGTDSVAVLEEELR